MRPGLAAPALLLTLAALPAPPARAESCRPLADRSAIVQQPADPAHPPLVLVIAGDTQLQSQHGGQHRFLTGVLEDRVVNVSIRPPAVGLLGPAALYVLLDRALSDTTPQAPTPRDRAQPDERKNTPVGPKPSPAFEKPLDATRTPDALLYLGDGANNGCEDEVDQLLATLRAVRRKHQVPAFVTAGNHDYLGNGNTNDPDARSNLCDGGRPNPDGTPREESNRALTRAEVLERYDAFNRESLMSCAYQQDTPADGTNPCAGKGADTTPERGAWTYTSHRPSCVDKATAHPMDAQPGCQMAAVIGWDPGWRTRSAAERGSADRVRIALVDTSDYADASLFPPDWMRGTAAGVSAAQMAWLRGEMRGRLDPKATVHRILASHYPLDDDTAEMLGCAETSNCRTTRLSAHTHRTEPCQTGADELILNVGSTTDDHPQVARVRVDGVGRGAWDPYFLYPGLVEGWRDPDPGKAWEEEFAGQQCLALIEGLRRAPMPPWRIRAVAGRSSGLSIYGLNRSYRDLTWTAEDRSAAHQNLTSLIDWWYAERPGTITEGEPLRLLYQVDRLSAPAGSPDAAPDLSDRERQRVHDMVTRNASTGTPGPSHGGARWPLDDLVACLAHSAAINEASGHRPDVAFTQPIDDYTLLLRPALDIRIGRMRDAETSPGGKPAFVGTLDTRFEWRRNSAVHLGLRAVRSGRQSADAWDADIDRFIGQTGQDRPEWSWRLSAGRMGLELGRGTVLDLRDWRLSPPRFDGIDASARVGAFGVRVGFFEGGAGQAPLSIGRHGLALASVEWCPRPQSAPVDPLGLRAPVGLSAHCAADRGLAAGVGLDVIGLWTDDEDDPRGLVDYGPRLTLELGSGTPGRPYLRLDADGHLQLDHGPEGGIVAADVDYAFQWGGELSSVLPVGALGLRVAGRHESLTGAAGDYAPFQLLYGRRHLRFGGSDALGDPRRFTDATLHVWGGALDLLLPREFLSIRDGRIGVSYDHMVDVGFDAALSAELKFHTQRASLIYGWHRLEDAAAAGASEQEGQSLLLVIGGSM